MFTFDKIDLQRITVSAVCAVLLSSACVIGAVAPAVAGAPTGQVAQGVK